MKKQASDRKNPFGDLIEWQDHRYDPGYFTGGKIHPLLRSRRPNKYGYVLIAGGCMMLFATIAGWFNEAVVDRFLTLPALGVSIIAIAGGYNLIKSRPKGTHGSVAHKKHKDD
jgi:hypothetical protein